MTPERRSDAGLSLVEVLVSLAIFGIIGIAGLTVLNTVARTGERTEGRLERLAEIDRAFLVIRRDLAQMAPGPIRLEADNLSFERTSQGGAVGVRFVRAGSVLLRRINVPAAASVDQRLLAQVVTARWRLMDGARIWHEVWPLPDASPARRPHGAELTLELRRDGIEIPQRVTRLFLLPAGQSR